MAELLDDADHVKGRPIFLTILCILTWVGSAIQFFWVSWWFFDVISYSMPYVQTETWVVMVAFAVSPFLTIWASIRIFMLKKGLTLYLIGELIPAVIVIILTLLDPPTGMFSGLAYLAVGVVVLVCGLFTFLYSFAVMRNKKLFDRKVFTDIKA